MNPQPNTLQDRLEAVLVSFIGEDVDLRAPSAERSVLFVLLTEPEQAAGFVQRIEATFAVRFDDETVDASFFQSLSHIARCIEQHRGARAPGESR